jgi:uncharacterized protein (TIGR03083 family)
VIDTYVDSHSSGNGQVTSAATPPTGSSHHEPVATPWLLQVLQDEGAALLALADNADLRRPVLSCPGWTAQDVVCHLTAVYRWVTLIVTQQRTERPPVEERAALDQVERDPISDLAAAHTRVVAALRDAPTRLHCWTMWPSDSSRHYWIRRQAHETLVHRIDIQDAVRHKTTTCADADALIAADGVDEMVTGFAQRFSRRLRAPAPTTLSLHAEDVDRQWWIRLGPGDPEFGRGPTDDPARTTVHARAGELLLLLWNRRGADTLNVSGPTEALRLWRQAAHL